MNGLSLKSRKKWKSSWKQIENELTTRNLLDTAKVVPRGKFVALQAYPKKQEKSQVSNLTLQLKELEKEQEKATISRRKGIIQIKAEINDTENKKKYVQKINETKSRFFEKINKIDDPLAFLV